MHIKFSPEEKERAERAGLDTTAYEVWTTERTLFRSETTVSPPITGWLYADHRKADVIIAAKSSGYEVVFPVEENRVVMRRRHLFYRDDLMLIRLREVPDGQ